MTVFRTHLSVLYCSILYYIQLEASFEKVELGETEHNVRRDLLRVSVVDARPMKVDPAGGGLMRRPSRDALAAYSRANAAEAALKTLVCCRLNILLFGILLIRLL